MSKIIKLLAGKYTISILSKDKPFEMFVRTILSQNTNDKNRDKAFYKLQDFFGEITPEKLASSSAEELEDLIKGAGLQRQKSSRIFNISKEIMNNYGGELENILKLPLEQARAELMVFKGIGYKTADIMLLFYCNHPFIPIDTHITRVSKRLGFAEQNAKYEAIRRNLELYIPRTVNTYKKSHLLLIELGRDTCNAINPKCGICVVKDLCPKKIVKKIKRGSKKVLKRGKKKKPRKK
ncbi:MAG: endonuclease III domain-containing protein [Candidatus Helarchaeota archaeon]